MIETKPNKFQKQVPSHIHSYQLEEKINVKKAKEVVIDVNVIGKTRWFIVSLIAKFIFFNFLSSLKNLPTIWTPSEFAIVSSTIGIEVWFSVK